MSLAGIFNVPKTDIELAEWSFVHMANHRDIIRVIYQLAVVALPEYVLDPFDPNDTGVWQRQHQQMHQQMNAVLGTSGFNLLGLDWHNENGTAAWITLNATEHRAACNILKLG